jgi:adenosine deaminase
MPWNNVATAIDLLQVDRVDHGYTIVDNPALLQRCIERGLVFTVVPTNSTTCARWRRSAGRRTIRSARCWPPACACTPTPTTRPCTWSRPPGLADDAAAGRRIDALRGFMLNGLDAAWMAPALRERWRAVAGALRCQRARLQA